MLQSKNTLLSISPFERVSKNILQFASEIETAFI